MPVISLAARVNCNGQHVALNAQTRTSKKCFARLIIERKTGDDPGAGKNLARDVENRFIIFYIFFVGRARKTLRTKSSVAKSVASPYSNPNKIY